MCNCCWTIRPSSRLRNPSRYRFECLSCSTNRSVTSDARRLNAVVLLSVVTWQTSLRLVPCASPAAITSMIALARASACMRGGSAMSKQSPRAFVSGGPEAHLSTMNAVPQTRKHSRPFPAQGDPRPPIPALPILPPWDRCFILYNQSESARCRRPRVGARDARTGLYRRSAAAPLAPCRDRWRRRPDPTAPSSPLVDTRSNMAGNGRGAQARGGRGAGESVS